MTILFFATDVHGSEICWKKFINAGKFYDASIIVLGGDITGKAVVPICHTGNSTYRAVLLEQETILHGEDEVLAMEKKVKSRGYYPYRTDKEELEELKKSPHLIHDIFLSQVMKTAEAWLDYADEKLEGSGLQCYVAPGNDDMFELDDLIRQSKHVRTSEGQVIQLDKHHEMISSGWTNPTPWHTYREESEEQLRIRYEAMIAQVKDIPNCVFNLHAPPYGSTLDEAPKLGKDMRPKYAGNMLVPVGSKSVRAVIDQYQPLLGLFGHIHEGKGAARLGRTLCINPGSTYEQGYLAGAVVKLEKEKIKNYILTNG